MSSSHLVSRVAGSGDRQGHKSAHRGATAHGFRRKDRREKGGREGREDYNLGTYMPWRREEFPTTFSDNLLPPLVTLPPLVMIYCHL